MKASRWDILKLAQKYEGEFNLADFSPEEIEEMLGLADEGLTVDEVRERYFAYYDDVKDRTEKKHKWSD
jgi:hypothetical protein